MWTFICRHGYILSRRNLNLDFLYMEFVIKQNTESFSKAGFRFIMCEELFDKKKICQYTEYKFKYRKKILILESLINIIY